MSNQSKEYYENMINSIILSKLFIIDLHSNGSEGSLIDIYSFIEKGPSSRRLIKEWFQRQELLTNISALGALRTIFVLSKFQSEEMDKIIIEQIYTDHFSNKKSNKQYKNVLVEGGGPIGLYATIKLFIEGMNVTLIDDSPDEYARNHFIFVDRKWMSELRYILGTGFDQLYVEDKSLLKDVNNDIGFIIKSKNLETVLRDRLNKLIEYVNNHEGNQEAKHDGKSFLRILNNTEIVDINLIQEKPVPKFWHRKNNLAQEKPMAILRKTGEINNFDNILPQKQKTSFFKKLKSKLNFKSKSNKNKKAILKLEKDTLKDNKIIKNEINDLKGKSNETLYGFEVQGITFDLFFCADSVNDNIRNKFLGKF
ncbi:unnamed protein product [Meloidogyne enterolobii]|uniref:Uncharacterized protein n=1 Tax=Meloidogyne enterolobii TaxID=390850 RepID=A0ACB0ZNX7_MELEN